MKKYVWLITLIAIGVLGTTVLADVANTKHNFTSSSASPGGFFYGTRQVCVFCHTPHNAGSVGPLTNHEMNLAESYAMYDSPTMDMPQAIGPHVGSLLCLSCHDGALAVNSLNNLPGPEGSGTYGTPGGSALDGSGKVSTTSDTYVGTDLSDDHPVGITYDASQDPDGFHSKTGSPSSYPDKLLSEGTYVECSSCHNPHDNTWSNFLVEDNSTSGLCVRCHTK